MHKNNHIHLFFTPQTHTLVSWYTPSPERLRVRTVFSFRSRRRQHQRQLCDCCYRCCGRDVIVDCFVWVAKPKSFRGVNFCVFGESVWRKNFLFVVRRMLVIIAPHAAGDEIAKNRTTTTELRNKVLTNWQKRPIENV